MTEIEEESAAAISNGTIDKIDIVINLDKIKKIIFLQSNIQLWEIKSNTNNKTYWIDFDKSFCSCRGFYYNFKKGKCYHIRAVALAVKHNKYKVEFLNDDKIDNILIMQFKNLIEEDV